MKYQASQEHEKKTHFEERINNLNVSFANNLIVLFYYRFCRLQLNSIVEDSIRGREDFTQRGSYYLSTMGGGQSRCRDGKMIDH